MSKVIAEPVGGGPFLEEIERPVNTVIAETLEETIEEIVEEKVQEAIEELVVEDKPKKKKK